MNSKFAVWVLVPLLALAVQATVAKPAEAVSEPGLVSEVHSPIDSDDLPAKPHGRLQFDEACAFGPSFAATLNRAKRRRDHIIRQTFVDSGDFQQDLATALGLECLPYSVGFD